jgi:hypothetical protein
MEDVILYVVKGFLPLKTMKCIWFEMFRIHIVPKGDLCISKGFC